MAGYKGKQGRKPVPTAVKIARGNPGKRPLPQDEPQPKQGRPHCPAWLMPEAKREWRRIVPELEEMGMLSLVDRAALTGYCQAWAQAREADAWMAEHGSTIVIRDKDGRVKSVSKAPQVAISSDAWQRVKAFLVEFGMTPSSRARVKAPPKQEAPDDIALWLRGSN